MPIHAGIPKKLWVRGLLFCLVLALPLVFPSLIAPAVKANAVAIPNADHNGSQLIQAAATVKVSGKLFVHGLFLLFIKQPCFP
jgi:hypothetical protein